jgi:hypothetical protein
MPRKIDFPPAVGKRFMAYLQEYHDAPIADKDRIAADALHLLREHYRGRLRVPDVRRLFELMHG